MNSATHTPGPWGVEDYFVFASNTLRIADCDCDDQDMPESEISANAHLIAAAPAMYEALQAMLNGILFTRGASMSKDRWQTLTTIARTALAQAEGRGQGHANTHAEN